MVYFIRLLLERLCYLGLSDMLARVGRVAGLGCPELHAAADEYPCLHCR